MSNGAGMEAQVFGGENHSGRPARPLWPAIKRGLLGRCPRCGEGKLFYAYTKTVDTCPVCGEEISLRGRNPSLTVTPNSAPRSTIGRAFR